MKKKLTIEIDEKILAALRKYVASTQLSISSVVTEAIKTYLSKSQISSEFKKSMEKVLEEHEELLKRLAK